MCTAGLALGAIGTYAQFVGGKLQSAAQQAEYAANMRTAEYAALIADNNAKIAEIQGEDARLRGMQKKEDLQREVGQVQGAGRTAYAAGNVQLGSGSPLSWEQDVAAGATRERIAIERNTDMERWGFKVQAQNERNQANLIRLGKANTSAMAGIAQSVSGLSQAGTLLSTARMFAEQFPSLRFSQKQKTPSTSKNGFAAIGPTIGARVSKF